MKTWGKIRKLELLPTQHCEAGYAPGIVTQSIATASIDHHTVNQSRFSFCSAVRSLNIWLSSRLFSQNWFHVMSKWYANQMTAIIHIYLLYMKYFLIDSTKHQMLPSQCISAQYHYRLLGPYLPLCILSSTKNRGVNAAMLRSQCHIHSSDPIAIQISPFVERYLEAAYASPESVETFRRRPYLINIYTPKSPQKEPGKFDIDPLQQRVP